jgi:Protein of unknown function (DUF3306)
MAAGGGFLSRWSRRKADSRGGAAAPEATPPSPPAAAASDVVLPPLPEVPRPEAVPAQAGPPPLPTLDDVAKLTHASDFSPFVGRGVDAGVRNAAMKKLFSDPRFNVMDGLDTYIDDYGKPDPIPLSMLRRMNQSAVLGLFADEPEPTPISGSPPAPPGQACPDGADPAAMAESDLPASPPADAETRADDDPDLQLQPDDADRRAGAGPGPRA